MDPYVAAAVAEAHRRDWGFVLAATARITRDLDAAEDCVQDAYAQALAAWPVHGVPARPAAWLTVVARRKAMNLIHRNDTLSRKLPLLADAAPAPGPGAADDTAADSIPDDRLRLIFTCCHPALAVEARVALTLRLLCGLTTGEVASAFLVSEPTMAARITRAKKKITATRIPYRVPPPSELPDRLAAVLDVVHLLFTTGHTAPAGQSLQRRDLAERALDLARMLRQLLPDDPAASGSTRPATSVPSGVPTPACANSCGSRVPADTSAPAAPNAPVNTRSTSPTQSSWGSVLMVRSS
jgi:RNA polymerase sigma-70 factor, ECF subfamily